MVRYLVAVIERCVEQRQRYVPFILHRQGKPIGDFRKGRKKACTAIDGRMGAREGRRNGRALAANAQSRPPWTCVAELGE